MFSPTKRGKIDQDEESKLCKGSFCSPCSFSQAWHGKTCHGKGAKPSTIFFSKLLCPRALLVSVLFPVISFQFFLPLKTFCLSVSCLFFWVFPLRVSSFLCLFLCVSTLCLFFFVFLLFCVSASCLSFKRHFFLASSLCVITLCLSLVSLVFNVSASFSYCLCLLSLFFLSPFCVSF